MTWEAWTCGVIVLAGVAYLAAAILDLRDRDVL